MTDHGNSRRGRAYCVRQPDDKTSEPFYVALPRSRERDVLEALMRAGATRCSFYDDPAPRWAASVHRLRKRGIDIVTLPERHDGDYPGNHARYVLKSAVSLVGGRDD